MYAGRGSSNEALSMKTREWEAEQAAGKQVNHCMGESTAARAGIAGPRTTTRLRLLRQLPR